MPARPPRFSGRARPWLPNLSSRWPPMFRTGDRSMAYVRARADRLPFRSLSADLILSSFLLEHVHAWRETVREMTRIGRRTFVAFGPNRHFPFEFGHIDAPLAHSVPLPLGASAAWAWGHLRGRGRSYRRLRQNLAEMNYLSSREFYEFCGHSGIKATRLFSGILESWAGRGRGGMRAWMGRRPALVSCLARVVERLGIEPNIYAIVEEESPDRSLLSGRSR